MIYTDYLTQVFFSDKPWNKMSEVEKSSLTYRVLSDFSNKLAILCMENYYSMPYTTYMYTMFTDRFKCTISKQVCNSVNEIYSFEVDEVVDFISSFMEKTPLLPNVMRTTNKEEIRRMFGKGEFPFIYINQLKMADGQYIYGYYISR